MSLLPNQFRHNEDFQPLGPAVKRAISSPVVPTSSEEWRAVLFNTSDII